MRVSLTAAGREMRDRCGCLGEELIARSGMEVDDLKALKAEVHALRLALERRDGAAA